jgi:hypothetical protein
MGPMRRGALVLIPIALALAGCGSSDSSSTPDACLLPTKAYLAALADAPGEVRLAGDVPLSDCLGETQGPGELADVGQTVIGVATQLNGRARHDPGGRETVMLGYLVGAVQQGASQASGIDADLVRRLDAAARFNPGGGSFGVAFEHAYGKGYAAGQETG